MSGSVEVAWWVSIVLLSIASSLIIYATLRDLGIFRLPPKTPEWPRRVYQSLDSNEGDPEPETDLVRVIEHPTAPDEEDV